MVDLLLADDHPVVRAGLRAVLELADDFALEMTHGAALHGPEGASPGWLARYPRA